MQPAAGQSQTLSLTTTGPEARRLDLAVRPAQPGDRESVAQLLYICSPGRNSFFAGSPDRAPALLAAATGRKGNEASLDVIRVVELDGQVVGVVAAFPASQRHLRRRRMLLVALRHRAPWHWPRLVRHSVASLRPHQDLPPATIYIDALATDEQFRRRGAARALLIAAIAEARSAGFDGIALHTHPANEAALTLYERTGFRPLRPSSPNDLVLLYRTLSAVA